MQSHLLLFLATTVIWEIVAIFGNLVKQNIAIFGNLVKQNVARNGRKVTKLL